MENRTSFKHETSRELKCGVCLSPFINPKELPCRHVYCKSCLDGIAVFQSNGSAIISCPLRCALEVIIDHDGTTNDISPPHNIQNITLEENTHGWSESVEKLQCNVNIGCLNGVTTYCSTCNINMCQACSQEHGSVYETHQQVPISFNGGKLQIICRDHMTVATCICCNNEFICVYCENRNHRGHTQKSLIEEVNKIKEVIVPHIEKVNEVKDFIWNNLNAANSDLIECEELFKETIKKRKFICLSNYMTLLNEEEERLMQEYENLKLYHLQQYMAADLTEYDIDAHYVLLQKELILKCTEQWKDGNVTVPSMNIKMVDSNYLEVNPLGTLYVHDGEPVSIIGEQITRSVSFGINPQSIDEGMLKSQLQDWMDKLDMFKENIEGDNRDVVGQESRLRDLEDLIDTLQADKKESMEKIPGLMSSLQRSKDILTEYTKRNSDLEETIKEHQEKLTRATIMNSQCNEKMKQLEQMVASQRLQLNATQGVLESHQQLVAYERKNETLKRTEQTLYNRLESKVKDVKDLQAELAEEKLTSTKEREKSDQSLEVLYIQLNAYKNDFEAERESREKLHQNYMEIQKEVNALTLENHQLREKINDISKPMLNNMQKRRSNSADITQDHFTQHARATPSPNSDDKDRRNTRRNTFTSPDQNVQTQFVKGHGNLKAQYSADSFRQYFRTQPPARNIKEAESTSVQAGCICPLCSETFPDMDSLSIHVEECLTKS